MIEYRNAHPIKPEEGAVVYSGTSYGLFYKEPPAGVTRFRYSVVIHERPLQAFSKDVTFSRKKDAKRYVSKLAIDWLIDNKFMPADGTVRFPKPVAAPQAAKIIGPQITNAAPNPPRAKGESFAGQVPALCMKLGFSPPKYEIERVSTLTPLYSGYAHFPGDPRIEEGKIGEVRDVHGQKNAKEQIAVEVVTFLKSIEAQRENAFEEDDRKRKRYMMESPTRDQCVEKLVKLEDDSD